MTLWQNCRMIALCSLAQGLSMTSVNITVICSFLASLLLIDNVALASIPYGLQFMAATICSYPVVRLMHIFGRKICFITGQIIGTIAGLICAYGLYIEHFIIFAFGSFILGINNACWQYIRFAVTEEVDGVYKKYAISFVLIGGLLAAFLGENLAIYGRDMWLQTFVGSYIAISCVTFMTIIIFFATPFRAASLPNHSYNLRQAFGIIFHNPTLLLAVMCGSFAYVTMVLIMTCSPFAMQEHLHPFNHITSAIKWHVIAMFAPSLVTGFLIEKLGLRRILLLGIIANISAIICHLSGIGYHEHVIGLVLLGLGWNFLFIGGTTLLVRTQNTENYLSIQGANDTVIQITNSLSAFSSGALIALLGWQYLNLILLIPLIILLLCIVYLRKSSSLH